MFKRTSVISERKVCDFHNVIFTHTSVVFTYTGVIFTHTSVISTHTSVIIDTYACEYDTYGCDYDTLECDLYTHSVISHAECEFTCISVKNTRMSVQITRKMPKSHTGCQNHTHDAKITLVCVV
jgi:hypothetical protein